MTKFLHVGKDEQKQMVSFVDLNAFLNWVREQGKVVIEVDGDKLKIRTL
jgi:hypothetical protein